MRYGNFMKSYENIILRFFHGQPIADCLDLQKYQIFHLHECFFSQKNCGEYYIYLMLLNVSLSEYK